MFLIRKNKGSSIKFLADSYLLLMGVTCWFVTVLLCLITFIVCVKSKIAIVWCFGSILLITISCLFALPKWSIIVEFSNNGIVYQQTFKKKIKKAYSDFGYIYCAHYTYFAQKKYIVFSQRRLSDYELTHINNVSVSDKLIKIKVRKGLKEELVPFLPSKYLLKISEEFW